VLKIDHDDSVCVSSSDDDTSDEEIAACLEPFPHPETLQQSDSLPGIESGLHFSLQYL